MATTRRVRVTAGHRAGRLRARLLGVPLAVTEPGLEALLTVPADLGARVTLDAPGAATRRRYDVTPGGVAVVPVTGPLVHRADAIDVALFGVVPLADVRDTVRAAVADPDVAAVVLEVDSPGGEVAGMFELADAIAAAARRKPIIAHANEAAFSAAYLLAAAASSVAVTRTAGVGSIGVLAVHVDESGALERAGIRYDVIAAGARKLDGRPDAPLNDEARAALEARVAEIYGEFVAAVARRRGLSVAAVRDTEAALFYGRDAVAAGLADRVATLEETVAALERAGGALPAGYGRQTMHTTTREPQATAPAPVAGDAPLEAPAEAPAAEPADDATEAPAAEPAADPAEAPAEDASAAPPAAPASVEAAPTAGATVIDLDAARRAARAEGAAEARAQAAAVVGLCAAAGVPGRAAEFIAAGTTLEEVAAALRGEQLATDAAAPIDGTHAPRATRRGPSLAATAWGAWRAGHGTHAPRR